MLFCIVLFCSVLCCNAILSYIALLCMVLYFVFHHFVLYCIVLYRVYWSLAPRAQRLHDNINPSTLTYIHANPRPHPPPPISPVLRGSMTNGINSIKFTYACSPVLRTLAPLILLNVLHVLVVTDADGRPLVRPCPSGTPRSIIDVVEKFSPGRKCV